jgi:hypothetical protein
MRFFRLFWIPEGADATAGAYVRENYDDLIRILALESVRQQVVIIGEDLGTVEPFVRETLDRFGILSYRLFYFEKRADGKFKTYASTRRARWFLRPRTICPRWRAFGPARTSKRAAAPACSRTTPCIAARWRSAPWKSRRCWTCCTASTCCRPMSTLGCAGARNDRRAAQRGDRLSGADAVATAGGESGGSDQGDRPAKPARHHLAIPELEPQDEIHLEELRTEPVARDFVAMFRNWLVRTGVHALARRRIGDRPPGVLQTLFGR